MLLHIFTLVLLFPESILSLSCSDISLKPGYECRVNMLPAYWSSRSRESWNTYEDALDACEKTPACSYLYKTSLYRSLKSGFYKPTQWYMILITGASSQCPYQDKHNSGRDLIVYEPRYKRVRGREARYWNDDGKCIELDEEEFPGLLGSWDFEENTHEGIAGEAVQRNEKSNIGSSGLVLTPGAFVTTASIDADLGETKTISAYVTMNDLDVRSGAVIGIERTFEDGHQFDSLVFAEVDAGEWMYGNDHRRRYRNFNGPAETETGKKILLTLVLDAGKVTLYRNSELYGTYSTGTTTYAAGTWRIIFGGRHSEYYKPNLPWGNIAATIHKAWVWDTARTPSQVRDLCGSLGDCEVTGPDASCHVAGYYPEQDAFEVLPWVETASDCQFYCAEASECEYFGYKPSYQQCSLYDSHGDLLRSDEWVFGPQECAKNPVVDTNKIICPFLATLINEGALAVRDSYTKFELETITLQAGIPDVEEHVHNGNFFHNPSGVQNIFDMEGSVNEHITSTGIHDCATDYSKCPESTKDDPHGTEKCPGAVTEPCVVPNVDIFERFFDHTDANDDGFIDSIELLNNANNFPIIDLNDVTGRGSVTGGFTDYVSLMGVDKNGVHQFAQANDRMDRATMRRVMIDRRFPETYMFPYISGGDNFIQLGDWRFGPVGTKGNHFSFSHRDSDRAVVYDQSGDPFNGGGNNFRLWDEKLKSGEYPSNVHFGNSVFTFGGTWKIGNIDNSFLSIEMKGDSGAVFEATGDRFKEHPDGERLWNREETDGEVVYFGDRFIQLGNFRFADAGHERFSISHSAFKNRGITFLENGEVVEGEYDYDNDVWDRPAEGICEVDGCHPM